MSDLERAYNALKDKQKAYSSLWNYYDGDHPLKYTNSRLADVFKSLDVRFEQNWCAVVVDSALDRINLARVTVADDEYATALLADEWERMEISLDDDSVHLAALVCGEAFFIVGEDGEDGPESYYNDPRLCHIEYDPDHPNKKLWAAKWWVDPQGKRRITLYYPDRFEYYVSRSKAENVNEVKNFVHAELPTAPNERNIIPVFHFRRERRAIRSELTNARTQQDAVNKLLTDMLVAAEFGAFRQRYIISAEDPDQLLATLRNAPNEIWGLPSATNEDQPTSVGEFGQTDLNGYLNAIDKLAAAIAIITRTPKHYLYQQVGTPSGEALLAMESPLVKKCLQYIERWRATWREVAAYILTIKGVDVPLTSINPVFDDPNTVLPVTSADIREKSVRAGLPLVTVLRKYEGWEEGELEELEADKEREKAGSIASLAEALLEQERLSRQPPEGEDPTWQQPPAS